MSTKNTNELVEEVRNADKEIARELINSGVRDAQSKWIEAHLITEALALEIIDIVRTTRDDRKVADLLRALASSIDKTSAFH
ncbi:MAG: hypothetical protein P8N73_12285 [Pseudomonadales bacterium]|jgi:hypothetical protein|nr:hypothetical protein [Pseudomonadales bacterium]